MITLVPVILIAGHRGAPGPAWRTVASTCVLPGSFSIAVCGNQLLNQAGQPVVLRGANTEGTQYDCAQAGADFDDSTIAGTNFSTGNCGHEGLGNQCRPRQSERRVLVGHQWRARHHLSHWVERL